MSYAVRNVAYEKCSVKIPIPLKKLGDKRTKLFSFHGRVGVYIACSLAVCLFNDGISSLSSLAT